jgi:hypothetical protein
VLSSAREEVANCGLGCFGGSQIGFGWIYLSSFVARPMR